MPYDKNKIFNQCIELIKQEKLCFFDEISLFVEPTVKTLYDWGFHESEDIKAELAKNKVDAKRKLKRNWQKEEAAPALQIAVFKLMANDDEFNKLTTSKSDIKADVKGVNINIAPLDGCEPIKDE